MLPFFQYTTSARLLPLARFFARLSACLPPLLSHHVFFSFFSLHSKPRERLFPRLRSYARRQSTHTDTHARTHHQHSCPRTRRGRYRTETMNTEKRWLHLFFITSAKHGNRDGRGSARTPTSIAPIRCHAPLPISLAKNSLEKRLLLHGKKAKTRTTKNAAALPSRGRSEMREREMVGHTLCASHVSRSLRALPHTRGHPVNILRKFEHRTSDHCRAVRGTERQGCTSRVVSFWRTWARFELWVGFSTDDRFLRLLHIRV